MSFFTPEITEELRKRRAELNDENASHLETRSCKELEQLLLTPAHESHVKARISDDSHERQYRSLTSSYASYAQQGGQCQKSGSSSDIESEGEEVGRKRRRA